MNDTREFLGYSIVQKSFSFTIIRAVRKILKLKENDPVNFVIVSGKAKAYISPIEVKGTDPKVIGSSLTSGNSVTMPERLREILGAEPGKKVMFYIESDGKISINI